MRRRLWVCFLCVAVTGVLLATSADASVRRTSSTLSSLNLGVLAQLNQIRVAHGLVPLRLNESLSAASRQHSDEMVADGYFAHHSFDGTAFWRRLETFYPQPSTGSWSVGENLLWTSGPLVPKQAIAMWMASPPHRANILNPNWREIGIASASRADAPGTYDDLKVIVVTTDFGVRS
jgi:uncharacterized protein YkwD